MSLTIAGPAASYLPPERVMGQHFPKHMSVVDWCAVAFYSLTQRLPNHVVIYTATAITKKDHMRHLALVAHC